MDRIETLVRNLAKPPRLSIERAKLYTDSMRNTEGEPMILRQAKALKNILENIPIQILDGELIVGTMLPNPPGAILFPEGVGLRLINELDTLPTRETNRLLVDEEDARILLNLRKLVDSGAEVIVRIPVIPGYNFEHEDFEGYLGVLESVGVERVDILPYHSLARDKYRLLGREYILETTGMVENARKIATEFVAFLEKSGMKVSVGGYF